MFADGSKSEEGSMLIGGDGIKSAVAQQLTNGAMTAFKGLGEGVFRIVDETTQPSGKFFLTANVRAQDKENRDIIFGWTMGGAPGVIKAPNDNYITGKPAADLAKNLTKHWHSRVKLLFDNMQESEAAFWKITCSSPEGVPDWLNDSRVTLIGDAVHAMTPAGGNDAKTAVRDSALLGRLPAKASSFKEGVTAAYEKEMRIYATAAIRQSYAQANSQFGTKIDENTPTID